MMATKRQVASCDVDHQCARRKNNANKFLQNALWLVQRS